MEVDRLQPGSLADYDVQSSLTDPQPTRKVRENSTCHHILTPRFLPPGVHTSSHVFSQTIV